MNKIIILLVVFGGLILSGCSANLKNIPVTDFEQPEGIPWVENKSYEVHVYAISPEGLAKDVLINFGVYELSDIVNGILIDESRPKWTLNYSAGPFAKGDLKLLLHPNGALKSVSIDSNPQVEALGKAATSALSTKDEIEKRELERLKRKLELKNTKESLAK